MLPDIQSGLPTILRAGSRYGNPTFLGALHAPVAEHPLSKFLNLPLTLVCCIDVFKPVLTVIHFVYL